MLNRNRTFAALCLVFAAASGLRAQSNTAEVFGGFSFTKANPESTIPTTQNMTGWAVGASGYATKWFGAGFEIAGQYGTIPAPSSQAGTPGLKSEELSYLAGPQFRFLNQKRVQSSLRILLGGVFGQVTIPASATPTQVNALGTVNYGAFNQTKFAAFFSVPVDISISRLVAIRVEPGLFLTNFNAAAQDNFRLTIGPVFRFGGHE